MTSLLKSILQLRQVGESSTFTETVIHDGPYFRAMPRNQQRGPTFCRKTQTQCPLGGMAGRGQHPSLSLPLMGMAFQNWDFGDLGLGKLRGLPGQLLSFLLFFFLLLGRCEALSISQVVHSNGQEHIQ